MHQQIQSGMGGAPQGKPVFVLGFADLGAGAVDTSTQGSPVTPTFTRATTAWTKLSTGLWASVASGTARSVYSGFTTASGSYIGYLAEGARTNLCIQARDLTATWTLLNTTAAKDQAGIDGTASSASSLTCSVDGGSCLQTITEAATLSALSLFIKRITGTGTITIQQGATTSDVTAQVNSSTYTRVELDATVLNPVIGIVLGTSGDKIAVDMAQFENGAFASSPIPTTTVSVTRNSDVLTYPTSAWLNETIGSALVIASDMGVLDATSTLWAVSDGSLNNRVGMGRQAAASSPGFYRVVSGGSASVSANGANNRAANAVHKSAMAWQTNDFQSYLDGVADLTDTSVTVPSGTTTLYVGTSEAATGANQPFGAIARISYYNTRLSNIALTAVTA